MGNWHIPYMLPAVIKKFQSGLAFLHRSFHYTVIIPLVLSHTHTAPLTSRPSRRKTDSNYMCEHTCAWVWTNTHIRAKTLLQVFASVLIEWQCWHWLQTLCVIPTACVSNLGSTVTVASEFSKSTYQSKALMCLNHYASNTGLCACSADCLVALNVLHIPKPRLKSHWQIYLFLKQQATLVDKAVVKD